MRGAVGPGTGEDALACSGGSDDGDVVVMLEPAWVFRRLQETQPGSRSAPKMHRERISEMVLN